MSDKITLDVLREAYEKVKNYKTENCSGDHNMDTSGFCYWCDVAWLSKEDRDALQDLFDGEIE